MRVLVASTGGRGHFDPLTVFADALAGRGDEVLLVVAPELEPAVAAGPHPYRLGNAADRAVWDGFAAAPREEQALLANREWFGRRCREAMQPAVDRACATFRPDLIVREPCEYASAHAAVARGLPFATVACSLAEVEHHSIALAAPVLPAGLADALHAAPYLSRVPASLDPSPFPDTRRYAPALPAAPGRGLLVYATFGTVAAGAGFNPYRALLDAVDGLDVEVLLTTGAELDLGPVGANVRVEPWVPQAEALAVARLVVCHGGSGTVLGALAAGLPLIVLPLFADQFANARRLAEAGAARVVGPDTLREAILAPPPPPLALTDELRAAPPPLTALRRAPRAAPEGA